MKKNPYLIQMYLEAHGIAYEKEYLGIPGRKYRFDFAVPEKKIAIEYEGGTWTGGAHTRAGHYASDCEKYSLAALHGWKVIRITADMLQSKKGAEPVARTLLDLAFL